ncbi:MAG: Ig-like domain-containing protein, partial [Bifidobacteriaceae bacterium]|nr:Ig-like domain-containing protein [Bifidobacteriaceae bacterium]
LLGAGGTPLGPLELDDSAYAIVGGVAQEAVLGGAATLLIAGERTVAASFAGVQGQTNVTVEPGPPVRVSASVLGATGNLTAGVPVQLAVAGYDAAGNAFDVTGRYEFSSSQASDAVEGTELVATAAGRRTVTATRYRDDGLSEETRLTVRVAAAAPATVNAEPVGPSAVADGGVAVFRVWTADPYGNEVGDVSASAVLTSTASGDTISANRVTVQGTGLRLITATSGSWTSTPATLTVVGDASAPEPTPTVTVPVPGPTVTVNVPVPGPTVPVPGPTVNVPVPGPTVAVPVPGPTVNVPVPGPTVTALADPGTLTDREALAPIARVKAAQQAIVLVKGRSATVPALAYLADGSKAPGTLTWKSANPRIASVARSGTILAKRAGRVLVTATASDGAAASIAVTVVGAKPKAAKAKAVTVRSVPKTMSVGAVAYATVSHTPARIAGAKVRFASSDTTILAVDEAGRIVARSPGTAILKATVAGKSKSVSVTVR